VRRFTREEAASRNAGLADLLSPVLSPAYDNLAQSAECSKYNLPVRSAAQAGVLDHNICVTSKAGGLEIHIEHRVVDRCRCMGRRPGWR